MKEYFYTGSYTETDANGIKLFQFDINNEKGNIITEIEGNIIKNPTYAVLTKDKKYLYAVMEVDFYQGEEGGGITAYKVNDNRTITKINEVKTNGKDPCHVSLNHDESIIFVSNYSEGTISIININKDGSLSDNPALILEQKGIGHNPERQEMAHTHFATQLENGLLAFCDLGLDEIVFYKSDDNFKTCKLHSKIKTNLGAGPRHFEIIENDIMYVLNELNSTISVYKCSIDYTDFINIQDISTLSLDYLNKQNNTAAAIKLSKNGKFILASNRGDDSIASYKINPNGMLELIGIYKTGGETPRDISFNADGQYVFCANQDSSNITILKFDDTTGILSENIYKHQSNQPVFIGFTN